ncbi:MAG TPA: hypothetical protein VGU64_09420, partial [Terriglobales bacterium]|nr:hypothetical protein [Terriglobales bacterium]
FNANLHSLPAPIFRDSTHAFGLIEAVELSRALKQLPSNLVIYGIEGQNFEAGTGLSPGVVGAVNDLVEKLRQEIEEMSVPLACNYPSLLATLPLHRKS